MRLLETLGTVVQLDGSSDMDVVFIEQSLMTAIENTARHILVSYSRYCCSSLSQTLLG